MATSEITVARQLFRNRKSIRTTRKPLISSALVTLPIATSIKCAC